MPVQWCQIPSLSSPPWRFAVTMPVTAPGDPENGDVRACAGPARVLAGAARHADAGAARPAADRLRAGARGLPGAAPAGAPPCPLWKGYSQPGNVGWREPPPWWRAGWRFPDCCRAYLGTSPSRHAISFPGSCACQCCCIATWKGAGCPRGSARSVQQSPAAHRGIVWFQLPITMPCSMLAITYSSFPEWGRSPRTCY